MSRSVRAPLAGLLAALLLGACIAPLSALPPAGAPPPSTPAAPPPAALPQLPPVATPAPTPPSLPSVPLACEPALADTLVEAFKANPDYAYRARGWHEFNTGSRRGSSRHRADLAFEGARQGDLFWWRRITGGLELYDEAVGDGSARWLRLPLWRSWQTDDRGEVELPDPLAELLAVEGWQAREIDEGCLLWAVISGRRTARDYTLLLDELGQPLTATSAGMRPNAPVGEGIPAAWWIEYEFAAELPELPSLPPATLPSDAEVALAMLAANDAPDSAIIWRGQTERDEVLAFRGPAAYGFVAWDGQGALTEAAIIDVPDAAADLLELYRLGRLSDESDNELYLVAVILDDRVAELSLKVDGSPRERLVVSAPGGLIGPLAGYLDDWRFFFDDGSRVPLHGR